METESEHAEPPTVLEVLRAAPGKLISATALIAIGVATLPCLGCGLIAVWLGFAVMVDATASATRPDATISTRENLGASLALALAIGLGGLSMLGTATLFDPYEPWDWVGFLQLTAWVGIALSPLVLTPFVMAVPEGDEGRAASFARAIALASRSPRVVAFSALAAVLLVVPIPLVGLGFVGLTGGFHTAWGLAALPVWLVAVPVCGAFLAVEAQRPAGAPASLAWPTALVALVFASTLATAALAPRVVREGRAPGPGPLQHLPASGWDVPGGEHTYIQGTDLRVYQDPFSGNVSVRHGATPSALGRRLTRAEVNRCYGRAVRGGGAAIELRVARDGPLQHVLLRADGSPIPLTLRETLVTRFSPASLAGFTMSALMLLLAAALRERARRRGARFLRAPVILRGRLTPGERGADFDAGDVRVHVPAGAIEGTLDGPAPATVLAPRSLRAMGYRTAGSPLPDGARCLVGSPEAHVEQDLARAATIALRVGLLGVAFALVGALATFLAGP